MRRLFPLSLVLCLAAGCLDPGEADRPEKPDLDNMLLGDIVYQCTSSTGPCQGSGKVVTAHNTLQEFIVDGRAGPAFRIDWTRHESLLQVGDPEAADTWQFGPSTLAISVVNAFYFSLPSVTDQCLGQEWMAGDGTFACSWKDGALHVESSSPIDSSFRSSLRFQFGDGLWPPQVVEVLVGSDYNLQLTRSEAPEGLAAPLPRTRLDSTQTGGIPIGSGPAGNPSHQGGREVRSVIEEAKLHPTISMWLGRHSENKVAYYGYAADLQTWDIQLAQGCDRLEFSVAYDLGIANPRNAVESTDCKRELLVDQALTVTDFNNLLAFAEGHGYQGQPIEKIEWQWPLKDDGTVVGNHLTGLSGGWHVRYVPVDGALGNGATRITIRSAVPYSAIFDLFIVG